MRLPLLLFYLLLLFLPTQLARHFFFDFTQISGIRIDYLAPTVYFTDLIVAALVASFIPSLFRNFPKKIKQFQQKILLKIILFAVLYLAFNVLLVAANKWVALYKFIKIIEFITLGVVISRLKPKLITVASVLSVGVFYSSAIALWQFLIQKSIGGLFWFLGERTFYAATPGIAVFSLPVVGLLLRPYATFPHPNALGGFMAVVLPFTVFIFVTRWAYVSKKAKTLFIVSLITGLAALAVSFSRAAWLVSIIGFAGVFLEIKRGLVKKLATKKRLIFPLFYILLLASVVFPLVSPDFLFSKYQYLKERVDLVQVTVNMVAANQFFGVGLNNSIIQAQKYTNSFPGLYIFQPVHNIFLLVLAETGIFGLFIFLLMWLVFFENAFRSNPVFSYTLVQLFVLGLFDHYLITLQQGQLMFVIFSTLIFSRKVAS